MHRLTILLIVFGAAAARNIDNRIFGGHDAKIEDYPYQVSIQFTPDKHICGGSILRVDRILTSAHCFDTESPRPLQVRAGSTSYGAGGTLHSVKSVVTHPQFDESSLDYDVAVVFLKEPVVASIFASPIPFAPSKVSTPKPGEMLTVSGWGFVEIENPEFVANLKAVTVPAVDHSQCKNVYEREMRLPVTPRMFCAGGNRLGPRPGDSGGAVINMKKQLVGIVSWGRHDAPCGWPMVYTDLASAPIQSFIMDNLK